MAVIAPGDKNTTCAPPCTEVLLMQKDIEFIKSRMLEMKVNDTEVSKKLDELNEKLDKRYAAKWVEKAAIFIIVMCVLAVAYFIFESVGLPIPTR